MISQTSSRELFDEIHCDIYIEVKIFLANEALGGWKENPRDSFLFWTGI